jgi:hypothetical protein
MAAIFARIIPRRWPLEQYCNISRIILHTFFYLFQTLFVYSGSEVCDICIVRWSWWKWSLTETSQGASLSHTPGTLSVRSHPPGLFHSLGCSHP